MIHDLKFAVGELVMALGFAVAVLPLLVFSLVADTVLSRMR